jgi:hypothetical protein
VLWGQNSTHYSYYWGKASYSLLFSLLYIFMLLCLYGVNLHTHGVILSTFFLYYRDKPVYSLIFCEGKSISSLKLYEVIPYIYYCFVG